MAHIAAMASIDSANGTSGAWPWPRKAFTHKLAHTWISVACIAYVVDLLMQTRDGLTNGNGRPFGDDFINYWSGAFLAWHHRAAEVYDWAAFHAFEQSIALATLDFYHYSYPPVLLVLTAPLAALPYLPALAAWLTSSWLCFYRALRLAMPAHGVLLLALATPAVFVNAVGGQNGAWTAALFGGGLSLLERRPIVAGILFALLAYKPQLGILIPIALVAGRQWRALASAMLVGSALIVLSVALFGAEIWADYLRNLGILRHTILEDGSGVWHRMVSVFVFARRLGAEVWVAYLAQAASGLVAACVVAAIWFKDRPPPLRNAALLLGTCLATPYLQDYDLVFGAFVVAWLTGPQGVADHLRRPALVASSLLLILPVAAAPVANLTGMALGPLFILPAFLLAALMSLANARAPFRREDDDAVPLNRGGPSAR